jgi:secreted trypsin-like serine protease
MKKLMLILLMFFTSVSLGGTIEPSTSDTKYIEYGSKFHSVLPISCFDGVGVSNGSAVAIEPNWIITAAHVVQGSSMWSVKINNKKYEIKKIFIHPEYKEDVFGNGDIALGYLEEQLELDHYPDLYESRDEVGKLCSMAGWGLTGTFNTGVKISDGRRRGGSNFVDKIEKNVLICSPSRKNGKLTELEYLICSGDSGGALFIDSKLAGIHSSVLGYDGKPDSTYGDESTHSRVSSYIPWIKEVLNEKK